VLPTGMAASAGGSFVFTDKLLLGLGSVTRHG
jgi:hypothetical protein